MDPEENQEGKSADQYREQGTGEKNLGPQRGGKGRGT